MSTSSPLWKRILITSGIILVAVVTFIFWPEFPDVADLAAVGEKYDATILRDTWGVPHIFGKTDADASYGLAYAHSEDDFLTIQQSLLAARGRLGVVYGPDAAPNDYMVQLLRIWEVVDREYGALAPETRSLLEAYADGLNHYGSLHPDEILTPELFPVTGKDIAAASVHKSPLFFGLDSTLGELFSDERQREISKSPGETGSLPESDGGFMNAESPLKAFGYGEDVTRYGSNTLAVGPSRSADGSTFFAVNAHQPWTGPVAWYEAHVRSEEGWDMTGALFPATPVIIHGHNRNLGWAFTVNHPDLDDVFVLDINPDNPDQYRFDGEWLDLEVAEAALEVKLLGRFHWTVKREILWSVYGPTVRQDHGVYAIRYGGFGRLDIFEQLYRMNKAANYDEWHAALADGGLPMFNVGYADKEGNIGYFYNALLPVRTPGYDWEMYLPGDTSDTLWTETLPFDDLPQVFNPASGFVQNANSSPYRTTLGPENPDLGQYQPEFGIETRMTNRALRALELFGGDDSITFEEFIQYKFDTTYSPDSDIPRYIAVISSADFGTDPDLQTAAEILSNWDLTADKDSSAMSLLVLLLNYVNENGSLSASGIVGANIDVAVVLDGFREAVEILKENFGRVDVPWGDVNRLRRGEVDLPLSGGPDLLHAIYGGIQEDGTLTAFNGDGSMMLVAWDSDGNLTSFSLHQFGSNTLHEDSPHYSDQAPLFSRMEPRPTWMDEAVIRANLEREYRPGDE